MAKSQLSDDELAAGIASMGGFGTLGQKPKRDSPFGSDYVRKPQVQSAQPPASPQLQASQKSSSGAPVVTSVAAPIAEVSLPKEKSPDAPSAASGLRAVSSDKEVTEDLSPPAEEENVTKHEKLSVMMTPEMRDTLSAMGKTLQRKRRQKGARFTANTVMRVAIQHFINTADMAHLSGVSSEEELLKEVAKRKR